ncbi:MAG TPA: lipopolysaccharide heptosyltransferase II, partial [Gammaproteobacteria bacterium]|nr:lipopolysaccharide heptosyltransferase II [Gammaproteobacteria bacterium]
VHVLAPPWSLPILYRMPEVARAVELDVRHGELGLGRRWRVGRALAGEGYGQAIVLPRSLKAALVPFFASIPVRTGFLGEHRYGLVNDVRPFDPDLLDQTVKRFVALGAERGEPLPGIEPPRLVSPPDAGVFARLGLESGPDVVALMPGAEYGPAKQWPIERFAELAARLVREGRRVWVLGSAKERALGERIAAVEGGSRVRNLCGATRLDEAIDLLAAARVAVTNDSGLMHAAAAAGAHVVAIYGSSSPSFTPPLTERNTIVYLGLACSPCFERTCPLGHLRCLLEISVDAVHEAVRALDGDARRRTAE